MADKSFGLKQINMIGVGTPTVESSTDLVVNTNGSERLRINSNGVIGIGETDLSSLGGEYRGMDVGYKGSGISGRTGNPTFTIRSNIYYDGSNWKYGEGNTSAGVLSVGGNQLIFEAAASGTAGATATISEKFRINSSGNLVLPSGAGIDFSATANGSGTTDSELLDDYEEGTWTAVFKYYNTSSGWQNVSFDSSPTNTTGYYIRVGKLVQFSYYSQAFDISTGSGLQARIVGLPFNVAGGNGNFAGGFFYHTTGFQQAISTGYVEPGTNEIQPVQAGSTSNATWDGGGTRYVMVCGVYRAA